MRASTATLLCALLLPCATEARRGAYTPGPRERTPTVGDSLDMKAENDYIGKDWQAVCVLTPGSANRRIITKDGKAIGMRRRRGMVTWLKKKEYWPWESPWADPVSAPFKVRYLKQDPAGIALSMAQEKKLRLGLGSYKGRSVVSVKLVKPRAWWKFWPAGGDE